MKTQKLQLKTILVVGAATLMFACSKEELDTTKATVEYGPARQVTVSASLASNSADKATLITNSTSNNYRKVFWEAGETLTLNNGTMTIDEIESGDATTATFTGSASPNTVIESGKDVYRSVYPASVIDGVIPADASPIAITLPAVQTFTPNAAQTAYNPMAAYTSVSTGATAFSLRYKNLCSVLKIELEAPSGAAGVNAQVSRIRLASTEGLSGSYSVAFSNGEPVLRPTAASAGNVTELVYSTPVDITTAKTFYIMVPPIQNKSLVMQVWNGDGSRQITKQASSQNLVRNNIYTISLAEPFNDWGGAISVSDNQKVYFAHGNLQHNFAQNKWRFAHEQYSILPDATRSLIVFPATLTTSYADMDAKYAQIRNLDIWTDLFGWGTSGSNYSGALNYAPYNTLWGYNATTLAGWGAARYGFGYGPVSNDEDRVYNFSSDAEHSYLGYRWDWKNCDPNHIPSHSTNYEANHNFFADWGFVNNSALNATISDPTKRAGTTIGQTWRTLSHNEWDYAYRGAKRIDIDGNYKCGFGRIDTTGNGDYANGFFFIPDKMHWFMMPQGLKLTPGTTATLFVTNTYTYAEFKLLESYGVVFLPACGARTETVHHRNEIGFYWSSSSCPATTSYDGQPITAHQHAYSFKIYGLNNGQEHITSVYTENKFDGNAVRLVRNTTDE
ncbi:MAG: hypothetical protein IJP95_02540 [Bacteroidales bacterium]|nr:hypothetical protein [Bacteroidales bacterium]